MTDAQRNILALYISTGLRVLSARIVLLIALTLTFAIFMWTMYDPTWNRIAAASIFGVLVFLPAARLDASKARDRAVISPSENE